MAKRISQRNMGGEIIRIGESPLDGIMDTKQDLASAPRAEKAARWALRRRLTDGLRMSKSTKEGMA